MKLSRRNRRTWVIAVAIAPVLIAAACAGSSSPSQTGSGQPQRGGAATIAVVDAMDGWNPQTAVLLSSYQIFPQVYAALLRVSPDGKAVQPALASSYKYDAPAKTITFNLDPAAKFSDGSPVTSADVKFSFGLWRAGELYGSYFETVRDVLTPDPHTAVFELSEPDATLPAILATSNAAIFPNNYGGKSAADYWAKPIGAGPFQIDSEVLGQSISMSRNPNYYRPGLPLLDKVDYRVVPDQNQQMLQFQSGSLDIINEVELGLVPQYAPDTLASTPSTGVSVLMTQTHAAPLDNEDFRHAISLAINHQDLIAGGYGGQAQQAKSVLPQAVPGVEPCASCDWSVHDLDEAKKLVTKSGYSGQTLALVVGSDVGPEGLAAQALQPMLAAAGINVSITSIPTSALMDRLNNGDFQLSMITYSALAPSPVDPLGFIATTGNLYTQSSTDAALTAVKAVHQAATEEQVSAATREFEQQAYRSAAVIPIAQPNAVSAVSKSVHGFVPSPFQVYTADEIWVAR